MKKFLVILVILFFVNFQGVEALGSIVIPTGVGDTDDLEKPNLVLVENNVNFNSPGNYQATYFSNELNSFVNTDVYVVNDNVLKEGYSRTSNRLYNISDSFLVKKTIYISKTEYYLIGEVDNNYNNPTPRQERWPLAYIEYYQNDQRIWGRKFDVDSTFNDASLTNNGLILGGKQLKNDKMNSWILEISVDNQIIRSVIFEENITSEIYAIELNDERLNVCETRMLTNSSNRLIYYKEFNYYNLNIINESFFGNNGFNSIMKVLFYDSNLYGIVQFAGDAGNYSVDGDYTYLALIKIDEYFSMVDYVKLDYSWQVDNLFVDNSGVFLVGKMKIGNYWNFYIEKYQENIYGESISYTWMHNEIVSSIVAPLLKTDSRGDFLLCYGSYKTSNSINVVKFSGSDSEIRFHYQYNASNFSSLSQVDEVGDSIKVRYSGIGLDEKCLNSVFDLTYIKVVKNASIETTNYIEENYDILINNNYTSKSYIDYNTYTDFGNYTFKKAYRVGEAMVVYTNDRYIKPKISLNNGEVYNNDIVLSFNGIGYLNSALIDSNYIIEKDGDYNFKLLSNTNDEVIISFSVSDLCYDTKDYQDAVDYSSFVEISNTASNDINHIITYGETVLDNQPSSGLEKIFFILTFILIGGLVAVFFPFKGKIVIVLVMVFMSVGYQNLNAQNIYQDKETAVSDIVIYEAVDYKIKSSFDKRLSVEIFESGELKNTIDLGSVYINVKVFELKEKIVVMYLDQLGFLYKIDINTIEENFTKQKIGESRYASNVDWLEYDVKIYLVGQVLVTGSEFESVIAGRNIASKSAVVLRFSNDLNLETVNIFGGQEDESFTSITVLNDNLYILGEKDYLAGGDFGNGGSADKCNMVLAKLSLNLELIDYKVILTDNKSLKVLNYEDDIVVVGDNVIASFNEMLYCNYYVEVLSINKAFKTKNNKILVLENDCFALYDPFTTVREETFEISFGDYQIIYLSDFENLKLYYSLDQVYLREIEIYNLDNYDSEVIYDLEEDKNQVMGLFRETSLVEVVNTEYFNENIFGEYLSVKRYKSGTLDNLELEKKILVPLRVNVREGEVYPLDYNLFFSGNATLNGENVENNHAVKKINQNKLILSGVNQTHEVNFLIENLAIKYSDDFYVDWDYEFFKNQAVIINIELSMLTEWEVKGFIVNDAFETNFTVDGNLVTLELPSYADSGVYKLHISKAYLEKDSYKQILNINKYFKIRILKDFVSLNCSIENEKLNISLIDLERCSRYLEINLVSSVSNYKKRIPFFNQMINLDDLENTNYQGSISLLCDYGNKELVAIELAKISLDSKDYHNIASLDITKSTNYLEEFSLDFKTSTLTSVTSGNSLIDLSQSDFEIKTVVIALLGGFCSYFIIWMIKKKVFKKV